MGAVSVLCLGQSGSGKSTSIGNIPELGIKGLDPKETIIINALGKDLPWRGSKKQYTTWSKTDNPKGNLIFTSHPKEILGWLKYVNENRLDITNIVIDDSTHTYSMEFIRRIGENGWEKFNDISYYMVTIANEVKKFRDSLTIFFMHHVKTDGDDILSPKTVSAQTIGNVVDSKMSSYESFFTIVLLAEKKLEGEDIKYHFLTEAANTTVKAPVGMFPSREIPNDLGYVKDMIHCYYNDEDCQKEEEKPVKAKRKEIVE